MNAALALTGKGTDSFTEALEEMQNSAGATETAYDQMEQGLGRSFDKIKAAFSVLSINIGERIAPVVANFAERFIEYMPRIESAVERAMDIVFAAFDAVFNSTLFQSAVDIFKDILTGASNLGESPIWQTIQTAFKNIAQAILDINLRDLIASVGEFLDRWSPLIAGIAGAMATFYALVTVVKVITAVKTALTAVTIALHSPFILIALAIGALIAIGVALWKNWDTIKEKAAELHERVKSAVQNMAQAVINFFTNLGERMRETISNAVSRVVQFFTNLGSRARSIVSTMVSSVVSFFSNLGSRARSIVSSLVSAVVGFFINLGSRAASTVSNMVSRVVNFFTNMFSQARNIANNLKNSVTNIFNSLRSAVANAFSKVTSAVRNGMQNAFNAVKNFFGRFKTAGANIIGNIAEGITGAIGKVTGAVKGVMQKARDLLPFSPPKDKSSPLAGIENNGIMEQIAKGIYSGEGEVNKAMNSVLGGRSFDVNAHATHSTANAQLSGNTRLESLIEQLLHKNQDIYVDGDQWVGATYNRYDRTGADKTQLVERWGR